MVLHTRSPMRSILHPGAGRQERRSRPVILTFLFICFCEPFRAAPRVPNHRRRKAPLLLQASLAPFPAAQTIPQTPSSRRAIFHPENLSRFRPNSFGGQIESVSCRIKAASSSAVGSAAVPAAVPSRSFLRLLLPSLHHLLTCFRRPPADGRNQPQQVEVGLRGGIQLRLRELLAF